MRKGVKGGIIRELRSLKREGVVGAEALCAESVGQQVYALLRIHTQGQTRFQQPLYLPSHTRIQCVQKNWICFPN
jgi:hypothetical protein